MDANLTKTQRIWKQRRARWQAYRFAQARRSLNPMPTYNPLNMSEREEREFLKREGEGD